MQTDNKETGDGSMFGSFRLPDKKTIFSTLYYGWKNLRIGMSGIWLFSLYIVLGLLVVFSLGAHQLQYAIKSTSIVGEKPLGIWQVLEVHSDWSALKAKMELEKTLANQYKSELKIFDSELIEHTTEITLKDSRCKRKLNELVHYLAQRNAIDKKSGHGLGCSYEALNKLKDASKVFVQSNNSPLNSEDIAEFDGYVNEVVEDIDLLNTQEVQKEEVNVKRNSLSATIAELFESNLLNRDHLRLLLENKKLGVGIGDFLNSLSYFEEKSDLPLVPNFAQMPSDILTLILVICMGALGGTISLTRLYLDKGTSDDKAALGTTTFLFKPLLGAISALAVFILAKAGVLIVSNPAPGGGASLSPFFVSFVGIVSGLLADQALETIRKAGNKWFEQAEALEIPRWAYGLATLLGKPAGDEAELDKKVAQYLANQAELAKTLDVSPQKIQSWIKEDTAVSQREQELISVYFRRSARYIFSDIKGE